MLSEQEFLELAKRLRHQENLDALLLYLDGAVIKGNIRMSAWSVIPFRYQRVSMNNALPSFRNDNYKIDFEAIEVVYSATVNSIDTTFPVSITAKCEKDIDELEKSLQTKLNASYTEKTIVKWSTNKQKPVENN